MDSFTREFKLAVKEINKTTSNVIRLAAKDLAELIIARTPVLSGALASNWNVTLNDIDYAFNINKVYRESFNITRYSMKDTIYIVNGAPYSELIEYGNYSNKAPSGMARVSALSFQAMLDSHIKL